MVRKSTVQISELAIGKILEILNGNSRKFKILEPLNYAEKDFVKISSNSCGNK